MRRVCLFIVLVSAVVIVGCGGGSDQTETTSESNASAEAPVESPAPLDEVTERLEAAGLTTYETQPAEATEALKVGGIEVLYYADPRDAAVTAAEIGKIAANHPNNGLEEKVGKIVIWTANQNGLSANERERFEKVVAVVGEGPIP